MNSINVYIIVEGQTEQTFVRNLLAPLLGYKGVFLHAILIGRAGHKGGDIRFDRAKSDITKLLKQRPDNYVSTMFDYYGINRKWPGRSDIKDNDKAVASANGEMMIGGNDLVAYGAGLVAILSILFATLRFFY